MVVVRIYGGLGNQMFQYAAGKALANSTVTSDVRSGFVVGGSPVKLVKERSPN